MREAAAPDPAVLNLPEAMRDRARTFVSTLTNAAATSPTIQPSTDLGPAPYLVIKVNGVRIAARGGNWGMDDARKRVSRERLEPYFRLNRDANLNIIRNWVGQSTEETFYELADEYGMMVWNDFWESTENYNIEAQDPALFLANAADTIQRFRNHPSIVVWCGRNEGVPQPIINEGLDALVRTLDGTRYYSPSSNALNLQGSGPYRYQVAVTLLHHAQSRLLRRDRHSFHVHPRIVQEHQRQKQTSGPSTTSGPTTTGTTPGTATPRRSWRRSKPSSARPPASKTSSARRRC